MLKTLYILSYLAIPVTPTGEQSAPAILVKLLDQQDPDRVIKLHKFPLLPEEQKNHLDSHKHQFK